MRTVLLILAAMFALSGCETSTIGGRCTADSDCDRSTIRSAACKNADTGGACAPGQYCICCPSDTTSDAGPPICRTTHTVVDVVDVGQPDATPEDVTPDLVSHDTGPQCSCRAGEWCNTSTPPGDAGPTCEPQKAIGVPCGANEQCQTDHCVDGVCCNSACTGLGLSCFASPDFAGICTPVASTDSGLDVTGTTDGATE